jgi:WD40 repeat protein
VTDSHWERIKDVVHQALRLPGERRASFVEDACASDPTLRAEVESLLRVDQRISPAFLASSPFARMPGCALAAGENIEGRFTLIRQLGEGGMGQVWLAEQTAPVRRLVALKLIRAGMYDEATALRFQAERQSLAMMDHPCIAKVFEAGSTSQGQPYFVMEYVPGLPITGYCDGKRFGIRQRLELFVQVCEGVQHAHQKAVIHRDLKPANILVVEVDGKPVPRIIDFGLARPIMVKTLDQSLSVQLGQLLGTPGYMSPEQLDPRIKDVDTRTDVYSLGVTLYVLLSGWCPFEISGTSSPEEWLRQQREAEPIRPSARLSAARDTATEIAAARGTESKALIHQLRGDLDSITMKALERERDRRYGTVSELAADLKRLLNHEPVTARPASALYRTRKFVRRHRAAAAIGGTVSALAIAASAAGLIAMRKQQEAEYQATQALQAQSRLLTEAAAQHLKDWDVSGAQGIILEVLRNPKFATSRTPQTISIFQKIRAADSQLAVLSGHAGWVYSVAPSPDGARIVTASLDQTARIWDARTGLQLTVLSGHGGSVFSATYSPDGSQIATASLDKTARLWDAHTGSPLATLAGHSERVYSAAYSPDGTRLVTASADRTARIWDARTGLSLAVLTGHNDYVRSAVYSPNGRYIVTASFDKTAVIWDARTGTRVSVLAGHGDRVYSAAYSPDGTRILTASADGTARIWDARTGLQVVTLTGHHDSVFSASYSSDGRRIVTASFDQTARTWDAESGAPLGVLSGHGGSLYCATYIPGSKRIVTSSADGTARVWELQGDSPLVLSGHDGWLMSAAFSAGSKRVVTASSDRTARIWDAQTGTQLAILSGHGGSIYSAAYSADGSRIVTASNDKTARVWSARTGELITVLSGHSERVSNATFSPDGAHVVTASADKTARIWDARTGLQLAILSDHQAFVRTAAYSPDGTHIVTASEDMTARIWDAHTGVQTAMLTGHTGRLYTAAYSPDGSHIVTASTDKTARIWDAHTGVQLTVLSGVSDYFTSAAYSPDGKYIVTTSSPDRTARIWNAQTGLQVAALQGHQGLVGSASYSPDGARIVTSSDDKTARIWDARVPADIAGQIAWDAAAETDPLSDVARFQFGLPPDSHRRRWPASGSACDQDASALYDPDRLTPGKMREAIVTSVAAPACSLAVGEKIHGARLDYEMGRVRFAQGDTTQARRELERAVARNYRAARIDLADLLMSPSAHPMDSDRAISLYKQAWHDGVTIAAFRLGQLYELSSQSADAAKAWSWYQKAAGVGEPNALARFAEREEKSALSQTVPSERNARLLRAFSDYAAAAERARSEDWPADAWRNWRYRRASLARVLAKEGMMEQVADAFTAVLAK